MQTSVSQILSKTGETVRSRFGGLLGIWGIYFGAQIVLFIVLGVAIGASVFGAIAAAGLGGAEGASAGMGLGAGMILMIILAYLAILAIAFAQTGSLIAFASPLQRLSLGEALNAGFRSILPLLGVFVVLMLAYIVCALIFTLVAGLLGSISSTLTGILGILLIPALIYVACRICTIYGVVAVEGVRNPITAIQRGWAQTGRNVLPIFAVMAVFMIAVFAIAALLFLPMFFSLIPNALGGQQPGFAGMGLTMIGALVFSVVIGIVSAALLAVIHGEVSDASPNKASDVFS